MARVNPFFRGKALVRVVRKSKGVGCEYSGGGGRTAPFGERGEDVNSIVCVKLVPFRC